MNKKQYDYIVVGSGAGGGVVAARLALQGYRVLVLEAGGDPVGSADDRSDSDRDLVADYQVPAFNAFSSEHPDLSWDFWVKHYQDETQQRRDSKYSAQEQGVLYPRSGSLGGCTAHNAMITIRPHNEDWNHIAESMGDSSWQATKMQRFFTKMERCRHRPFYRFLSYFGFNPTGHGWNGWLQTEKAETGLAFFEDRRLRNALLNTIKEILNKWGSESAQLKWLIRGLGDPNDIRLNNKNAYGVRYSPMNTVNHSRNGPREFLLNVKAAHPERLEIALHSLVTKIIFDEHDTTLAIGVEYLVGKRLYQAHQKPSSLEGEVKYAYAKKEIIIAGGAFNTPQILQLSGIGPREHLNSLGIDCRLDLNGVGKNLQDRYEISVVNKLNKPWGSLAKSDLTTDSPQYNIWKKKKKGVYTSNGAAITVKLPVAPEMGVQDLFLMVVLGDFHGYFKGYSEILKQPDYLSWVMLKAHTNNTSGEVRLISSNPKQRPEINFNYFDPISDPSQQDLHRVLDAVKLSKDLTAALGNNVVHHVEWPKGNLSTDSELAQYIKDEAWGHHACGTCAMKPLPENGVVDSAFRVYGTKRLRIVDASIFPRIPGFFIATSVYMIAEKAAEVIGEAAPLLEDLMG